MESYVFIEYFVLSFSSMLFILLFKFIYIWPLGAFSVWFYFPVMHHQTCGSSITYNLFKIFQSPVYFQFPQSTQYFLLHSHTTLSDFYFWDKVKQNKKESLKTLQWSPWK